MKNIMSKKHFLLAAVLICGALVRLAYGLRYPALDAQGHIPDSDQYVALASSFADTWSFFDEQGALTAHREPGYPIILGLFFKVLGKNYHAVLLTNTLIGLCVLFLMYRVGSQLFGESVGLVAAAIGAVYPPFIYYAAQPLRETWMGLIGCLTIWLLMKAFERSNALGFAAAGATAAVAGLTNTTLVPFGLLVPVVLAGLYRFSGMRALKWSVLNLSCFLLLYSLWPLRNYRVFHAWIFGTTTSAGNHFYMFQIVPQEVGGTPEHYAILARDPIWQQGMQLEPVAREKFFWKAGLENIRRDPLKYARLVAWRFFWDQWRLWPRPRAYEHSYQKLKWVSILSDGWIIPLGLIGILLVQMTPASVGWLYLWMFSVGFSYSLVLTMLRYRLSSMPWIILLAAVALKRAQERLCPRK